MEHEDYCKKQVGRARAVVGARAGQDKVRVDSERREAVGEGNLGKRKGQMHEAVADVAVNRLNKQGDLNQDLIFPGQKHDLDPFKEFKAPQIH
jgi:hypothetical protein